MNHQRDLIQKALLEEKVSAKQRTEIDREFLKDLTSAAAEFHSSNHGCFAQISFAPNIGTGLVEKPSGPPPAENQWFETLKRYEDKYSSLQKKQRALEAALEAVNTYYPQRIHTINQELEKVQGEHLLLIGKTAAPMTFPFVRMRRGPSVPPTTMHGSGAGRLARRFYYRLFGRWPRVSKLSPYWGALHHLTGVTERAARSAKDVLYVGDRSNVSAMLANSPGLHAWTSVAGLITSGTGGTVGRPQFDTCLCDLEFADLGRLSVIYGAARPFMRPGATIIAFYMNLDGTPLPLNELAKDLRNIPGARIYYSGSNRSANLLRAFRSTLSTPRGSRAMLLAKIAIRLGLLAPRVWISHTVQALASEKRQSTPPAVATSITTEIRLPESEGDNVTV
jgi:hypothetical protein